MRPPILEQDVRAVLDRPLPWDRLSGKTVLLTGAGGMLPSAMVDVFLALNEPPMGIPVRVLAVVRDRARAEARFAHYRGRPELTFLVQDVSVPVRVPGRVDYVIHAASQASPKYFGTDPAGTMTANVIGTHHLLELAREHRSEGFLFFSTSEVYGLVGGEAPITEASYASLDPTELRSCYAEGKRCGETMCVAWHNQHRLPTRIVRPFHTYGPGMKLDDGRVFADLVSDVIHGRDLVLKSDGGAVRAFCYVADAVAGYFTVLFRGGDGQAYNVGDEGGACSVLELARLLAGTVPELGLKVIRQERPAGSSYIPSAVNRSIPDTRKLRALGWSPRTTLADGFTRTVAALRASGRVAA